MAPLPIHATIDTATGNWTITFDQPLQPRPVNAGAFSFRRSLPSTRWYGSTATAAGSAVTGTSTTGFPTSDPEGAYFSDAAGDVVGLNGLPVVSFNAYPTIFT